MPKLRVKVSATVNGATHTQTTDTTSDNILSTEKSAVAVAKTGQLTTRTDNDTGTLTMTAGHGIITGDKLFLFWSGGSRRTIAGTVATNSVPIDLGAGDNLPANLTNVTVCVALTENFVVTGSNVTGIKMTATREGAIQLTDASDAEIFAKHLDAGESYVWWNGNGVTNPVTGGAVAKAKFGNGDSVNTNTLNLDVLYN